MKKDVLITILDEQLSDGETERLEITTAGTLKSDKNGVSISYDEVDGALQGCVTTLKIESPTCVTMSRNGPYSSQLILEQNKRHSCYYETPVGSFMMGVFAKSVGAAVGENGGVLNLKYTVDFNSGLATENTMTITVKGI